MDKSPFKTSDLGLAAYLYTKSLPFVGVIPSGEQGRLFFVFEDSKERDDLCEEWTTSRNDAAFSRKYFQNLRVLKRELKNPMV